MVEPPPQGSPIIAAVKKSDRRPPPSGGAAAAGQGRQRWPPSFGADPSGTPSSTTRTGLPTPSRGPFPPRIGLEDVGEDLDDKHDHRAVRQPDKSPTTDQGEELFVMFPRAHP